METAFLVTAFVSLFVVIDPIGLLPIFVALTSGMTSRERLAIALRACGVATAILLVFSLFGEAVLGFIGITLPAFRIAGGALLFLTALDMLSQRRKARRQGAAEEEDGHDPSVFPLAIPLIAGPGAIATMILLTNEVEGTLALASVIGIMLAVIALVLALFLTAPHIEAMLGRLGIDVVTRLLGMLLAALSIQFIIDGVMGIDWSGIGAPL